MDDNSTKKIEIKRECPTCSGTGLYTGVAEKEGAAVICHGCKGAGFDTFRMTYHEFTGRKKRDGVTRVYATNPGIGLKSGAVSGGVPVEQWERDCDSPFAPGAEMREETCPAWWYQSADYSKQPKWKECTHGMFIKCPHFENKRACWERWDRENDT